VFQPTARFVNWPPSPSWQPSRSVRYPAAAGAAAELRDLAAAAVRRIGVFFRGCPVRKASARILLAAAGLVTVWAVSAGAFGLRPDGASRSCWPRCSDRPPDRGSWPRSQEGLAPR
jgi:hypothetical protein